LIKIVIVKPVKIEQKKEKKRISTVTASVIFYIV